MKKYFIIIVCAFLSSAGLMASTIAYWGLDGNLTSSVGSNLTGTVYGTTAWSSDKATTALGSQSLSLSGAGYVRMNSTTGITTGRNAFTIEAFINPSTSAQMGTIYSEDGTTRSTYLGYFGAEGYIRFFIGQGSISPTTSGCEVLDIPMVLSNNTWYHIAATFDGATKTIGVYLNGILIGSRSVSLSTVPVSGVNATIGGWSYTYGNLLFNGKIDQVRISDQSLTTSQFLITVPEPSSWLLCIFVGIFLAWKKQKS